MRTHLDYLRTWKQSTFFRNYRHSVCGAYPQMANRLKLANITQDGRGIVSIGWYFDQERISISFPWEDQLDLANKTHFLTLLNLSKSHLSSQITAYMALNA